MDEILFSSQNNEWETPEWLFSLLNSEFKFTLDAAASIHNAKCSLYLDKDANALSKPWVGRVFLNPPYGNEIAEFVAKAYNESQQNAELVVCLIPARTDTKYWHNYCMKSAELRFIQGRLKFTVIIEGRRFEINSAPFPSVVVVFLRGEWKPIISAISQPYTQQNTEVIDNSVINLDDYD